MLGDLHTFQDPMLVTWQKYPGNCTFFQLQKQSKIFHNRADFEQEPLRLLHLYPQFEWHYFRFFVNIKDLWEEGALNGFLSLTFTIHWWNYWTYTQFSNIKKKVRDILHISTVAVYIYNKVLSLSAEHMLSCTYIIFQITYSRTSARNVYSKTEFCIDTQKHSFKCESPYFKRIFPLF